MQLTARQLEIIRLLAHGESPKRIAGELGITLRTVRHHVRAIAARIPGDGPAQRKVLLHAARLGTSDSSVSNTGQGD